MIYIHIPFCEHKCPYCAFNSTAGGGDYARYFAALITQFHHDRARYQREKFNSVYIGGGTPSFVPAKFYEPLFEAIAPFLAAGAEITIEANPNSLSFEWARALNGFGANRISIGVQSFSDEKLRILGRIHTANQAQNALETAVKAGFNEISADFIYGARNDNLRSLTDEVKRAKNCGATHISAYRLTADKGAAWNESDFAAAIGEADYELDFAAAIASIGFPRYEVSNYGRNPSRHNLGYWLGNDYLGLGAGAAGTMKLPENFAFNHSALYAKSHKEEIAPQVRNLPNRNDEKNAWLQTGEIWERYEPVKSASEYLKNPLEREVLIVDRAAFNAERVMLMLRANDGLGEEILNDRQKKRAAILIAEGVLSRREINGKTRLINNDLFLADEIYLFLNG
ncbi:MAG: radical SAM family heme chaperone HemW [Helicobacteraceae bacterium]|nr:radical SAM family heme chaperone HemW [Helicobacteraceae bacterium]